jgi:hypothetical protein
MTVKIKLKVIGTDTYEGTCGDYTVMVWRSTERFTGTRRGYWVEKTGEFWRGRVIGDGGSYITHLDPVTTRREVLDDALRIIARREAEEKKRAVDTSWIDLATS